MKVTYSVTSDTANSKVSEDSLTQEILDSSITIALDYISVSGDVLDINFKANLISGEQSVLDAIIAAHTGEALPENEIAKVQITDFQDLTGHNVFRKGYYITATAGQTTEHEAKYTSDMLLQGIAFVSENAIWGDYIEVELVDVDNVLGYGAGVVLGKFAETLYVTANMIFEALYSDAKLIPAGIYIRYRYVSTGATDVKIALQHLLRTT